MGEGWGEGIDYAPHHVLLPEGEGTLRLAQVWRKVLRSLERLFSFPLSYSRRRMKIQHDVYGAQSSSPANSVAFPPIAAVLMLMLCSVAKARR